MLPVECRGAQRGPDSKAFWDSIPVNIPQRVPGDERRAALSSAKPARGVCERWEADIIESTQRRDSRSLHRRPRSLSPLSRVLTQNRAAHICSDDCTMKASERP